MLLPPGSYYAILLPCNFSPCFGFDLESGLDTLCKTTFQVRPLLYPHQSAVSYFGGSCEIL